MPEFDGICSLIWSDVGTRLEHVEGEWQSVQGLPREVSLHE